MRIAVCLSGEPRTWRIAHPIIKEFFNVPDAQVDYFIHTWLGNSWKIKGEFDHHPILASEAEEIRAAFSPVEMRYDGARHPPATVWGSLFASQQYSFMMKREHELRNGFEYDIVIKARLDTIYTPDTVFAPHHLQPLTAYTAERPFRMPMEYNACNFNEVIYYGDSPTMDLIGDVVQHSVVECNWAAYHNRAATMRETIPMKYGPGAYMNRYMAAHNIYGTHAPKQIEWVIVRKDALDLNLDPFKDFIAIRDLHGKHYTG